MAFVTKKRTTLDSTWPSWPQQTTSKPRPSTGSPTSKPSSPPTPTTLSQLQLLSTMTSPCSLNRWKDCHLAQSSKTAVVSQSMKQWGSHRVLYRGLLDRWGCRHLERKMMRETRVNRWSWWRECMRRWGWCKRRWRVPRMLLIIRWKTSKNLCHKNWIS